MGSSLAHVMVVGGTRAEWQAIDDEHWRALAHELAEEAAAAGAAWLTIRAYEAGVEEGEAGVEDGEAGVEAGEAGVEAGEAGEAGDPIAPAAPAPRRHVVGDDACTVLIDPLSDGRERFAEAMRRLPPGIDIDEKTVAGVLYEPADVEPDLVLVLGPSTRLPPSLVWELAYGELVFLERPLAELRAADLRDAIVDFQGRRRRFGGLDS